MGTPTPEVSEQTLTIAPSAMRRAAAWAQKKAPLRLVSTILSQSASSTSSEGLTCSMPALLIRMSSPPSAATARSIAGSIVGGRAHVERERHGLAAGGLDLLPAVVQRRHVARADRDVGAKAREACGQRRADAAAGARDDRPAAGQGKIRHRWLGHGDALLPPLMIARASNMIGARTPRQMQELRESRVKPRHARRAGPGARRADGAPRRRQQALRRPSRGRRRELCAGQGRISSPSSGRAAPARRRCCA